jgi:PAS domain S-box-containing protein
MKAQRIRRKFIIGFTCVVGIFALQGAFEYWRSTQIEILLRDAYGSSFKEDVHAGEMLQAAIKIRLALNKAPPPRAEVEEAFQMLRTGIDGALSATKTSEQSALKLDLSGRAAEEKSETAFLNALRQDIFFVEAEWRTSLSRGTADDLAREKIANLLDDSLIPGIAAYAAQSSADMAGETERALRMVTASRSFLVGSIGIAIIAALVASFLLAQMMVSPVEKMTESMERVSRGESDLRISLNRADEFGTMAATLNKMLDSLKAAAVNRSQLEAKVNERTRELDQFFLLSIDMLCIADFSGVFLRVNPAFEEILGYSATELVSQPFLKFIHPDDQAATAAEIEKYRSEGKPSLHFENRYRCKDGSWKLLSWNATPVREAQLIFAMARDVTELRAAEQTLRESEQSLSITLQSIGEAVLVTDAEGRIARMNPIAETLTGWTLSEAEGRTISEVFRVVHEVTRVPAKISVDSILASRQAVEPTSQTALIARDGTERLIAKTAAPLRNTNGQTVGMVLVFRDVSREQLAREQEQKRLERVARFQRAILSLRDAESSSLEEFFRLATEKCAENLEIERACIWIHAPDHSEIYCADLYERTPARHSSGARLQKWEYPDYFDALSQLEPIIAEDVSANPATRCLAEHLAAEGVSSMLDTPIRSGGRLVGVLCCEHINSCRAWDSEEVKFANSMAGAIMLAIERSERESAEAKLRESEEYNRSIVQSSEDCLKILSLDGRLLEIAEQGQRAMGIDDPDKFRGADWIAFFDEKDQPAVRQALADARTGGTGRFQACHQTMAGTPKWWDVVVSPIYGESGTPVRLLAVSRDVSRQHEAEDRLRELNETLEKRVEERTMELAANERRFRLMVEQVEDYAIFMLDADGIVSSWNAGAQRTKGYTAQEIIGRHYSCFYRPQDIEAHLPDQLLRQATMDGHVRHEGWRVRKDGSMFWADVDITAIRESGVLQGFAKVTRDLTELRNAELSLREAFENQKELTRKAQAGENAKSEFLAVMSHEVRTPMNGIIGYADILSQAKDLSPEHREYALTMYQSGRALLRILDDILDFSSIEAGTFKVERVIFSLRRLLDDIRTLLLPEADQKGVELLLEIAQDVPERLLGDPGRLRQIVLNLAGNALKFTETGFVRISSASAGSETCPRLQISVRDTGPGVPSDRREAIFAPFTQADVGSARRHGGTGLGLAISKRMAEFLGGTLTLQSEMGVGSEFLLELPIEPIEAQPYDIPLVPQAPNTAIDHQFAIKFALRIMVVEDDRVNMRLTLTLLQKLGYEPVAAANGSEAVEVFREKKPNCILMDLQMPVMDGIDATKAIRDIEKAGQTNPAFIVALTANTVRADRSSCFRAGMNGYLNKPLRRDRLCDMLAKASEATAGSTH